MRLGKTTILSYVSAICRLAIDLQFRNRPFVNLAMTRPIPLSFIIAGLLAGALSAQPRLIRGLIQDRIRAQMTGHIHPLARAENDLGEIDQATTLPAITFTLEPTPEQQADLERLLAAQQDSTSPQYHRWLTPEEYADRFGASKDDIAKITDWLAQQNLHVTSVGRSRTSVSFSGAVSDVEETLQIRLHRYRVNGERHYANTTEPSTSGAAGRGSRNSWTERLPDAT
jgi:hypothetical protein